MFQTSAGSGWALGAEHLNICWTSLRFSNFKKKGFLQTTLIRSEGKHEATWLEQLYITVVTWDVVTNLPFYQVTRSKRPETTCFMLKFRKQFVHELVSWYEFVGEEVVPPPHQKTPWDKLEKRTKSNHEKQPLESVVTFIFFPSYEKGWKIIKHWFQVSKLNLRRRSELFAAHFRHLYCVMTVVIVLFVPNRGSALRGPRWAVASGTFIQKNTNASLFARDTLHACTTRVPRLRGVYCGNTSALTSTPPSDHSVIQEMI